jgi:feruloyl esterase
MKIQTAQWTHGAKWTLSGPPGSPAGYGHMHSARGYCRVGGLIEGTIRFEVWLPAPDRWNGRLLGTGVGGSAGTLNYSGLADGVDRGFATASTDTGHTLAEKDWMLHSRAARNYADRGVHLMTLAAKAVIERFYGHAAGYAYFEGCSGGGREAMKEMEEYPKDYNGVLAGAPGVNMPLLSVRHMLVGLWQQHASDKLTAADWQLVTDRVVATCDTLDGVKDGVLEDPRRCQVPWKSLLCGPGQSSGCLTASKLALMEKISGPIVSARGMVVDEGLLPGATARPGPPPPLLMQLFGQGVHHDLHWNANAFDPDRDLAAVYRRYPHFRADDTDLQPFKDAGGKAILYQGWMDPSVLPMSTVKYYEAVTQRMGGSPATDRFVRLFMVPGMLHCKGGSGCDRFGGEAGRVQDDARHDALRALIRWVERGKPPNELVASRMKGSRVVRTRLLCPYPQEERYRDSGSTNSAGDFYCAPPAE